jgi:hypothetical protein
MSKRKTQITSLEINGLVQNFLQEVEDVSRRHNGDGCINYPYATGVLQSTLREIVTLATTGATGTEIRDVLETRTKQLAVR